MRPFRYELRRAQDIDAVLGVLAACCKTELLKGFQAGAGAGVMDLATGVKQYAV